MSVDEYSAVRAHAVRLCVAAGATVEEAEDCVHEALVELLEVADPAAVRTPAGWVATVSRRRFIDQVRRRCRERVANRRSQAAAIAPVDPADLVADRDLARYLVRSMADLPPTTQEVCAAIGAGKSEADVAASLGLTARAVESHLTRARRRLRKLRIAVVLPIGVCCARLLQRLAVPLTCAAVATPVAAVLLLPGATSPRQPVSGPETPAALTTTVVPPVVTTSSAAVRATASSAPMTSGSSSRAVPVAGTPVSVSSSSSEVVPRVETVLSSVLQAVPTSLPSLPELPVKLPFGG